MSIFSKRIWKNREGTNLNRRTVTNIDTEETKTYDIYRDEGKQYETPLKFDASVLNDIEDRIESAFDELDTLLDSSVLLDTFYPIGSIYITYDDREQYKPGNALGGNWQRITGGVLVPADGLPNDMINNLQFEGEDEVTIPVSGSVSFGASGGRTGVSNADMPSHYHTYTDVNIGVTESWYNRGYKKHYKKNHVLGSYTQETPNTSYPILNNGTTVYGAAGHSHEFSGSGSFRGNALNINKTKPGVTVCVWVRVG